MKEAGDHADGGELPLVADERDTGTGNGPDLFRQMGAEHDGVQRLRCVEGLQATGFQPTQQFGRGKAGSKWNAFQHGSTAIHRSLYGDLTIQARSGADHVRKALEAGCQTTPLLDAIGRVSFEDADVGRGAEQCGLQRTLKPIVDGQRDDKGGHPGSHPKNGDGGDDGDDGLLAFRAEVAKGDDPLEARHYSRSRLRRFSTSPPSPSGRSKGKRMTSRMDFELVISMVRRSMPIPSPPAGGIP